MRHGIMVGARVAPLPGAKPLNVKLTERQAAVFEGKIGDVRSMNIGGSVAQVKFRGVRKVMYYDVNHLAVQAEIPLLGGITFQEDANMPPGAMLIDTGKETKLVQYARPVSYGAAYQDLRTAVLGLAAVVTQLLAVADCDGATRQRWRATLAEVVRPLLDSEDAPTTPVEAPTSDETAKEGDWTFDALDGV